DGSTCKGAQFLRGRPVKRELPVAEETVDDSERGHDRAADVRSGPRPARERLERGHEHRQAHHPGHYPRAIDRNAPEPLTKVVALGLEDEPLVADKGDRNVEEAGEGSGEHIPQGYAAEQGREQRERPVTEERVAGANDQITRELTGGEVMNEAFDPGRSI